MELLEGEALRRRLEECLLFVRRATDFEVQIANGLAAHAKANSCSRSRREESPRREEPRAARAKPGADEPEGRNPSEAGVATVWLGGRDSNPEGSANLPQNVPTDLNPDSKKSQ
jgi:hypothetical protein